MAHPPRPGVRLEQRRRDRLIRLAPTHPAGAGGFAAATGWSRVAPAAVHAWTAPGQPLRLGEQTVAPDEPKAVACAGLLARRWNAPASVEEAIWLRFVDGRPISGVTPTFLAWGGARLAAAGQTARRLGWANAGWPICTEVRAGIAAHHLRVEASGAGGRSVPCRLPANSPWPDPIDPKGRLGPGPPPGHLPRAGNLRTPPPVVLFGHAPAPPWPSTG